MNITCYIIDDEFHAIELLKEHIIQTPGLELLGFSESPITALSEVQSLRPDLIFLDIDMSEMSGLVFADMVTLTSIVVFTTSFKQYALEAYEKQIFDYLLKPINYDRFAKCIFKVRRDLQQKNNPEKGTPPFFYIKTDIKGKLSKIEYQHIIYIEAAQNYVYLHLTSGKQMAYLTIGEISDYLNQAIFSRIHKSYIIQHLAMESLEPGQVKLKNGPAIPIGRSYKVAFMKKMENHILKSRREP